MYVRNRGRGWGWGRGKGKYPSIVKAIMALIFPPPYPLAGNIPYAIIMQIILGQK
jgi:hypothetical protein